MSGGRRGSKQDGFGFIGVEGETVEKKPATDCCRAGGQAACVAGVNVVKCNVELCIIRILMMVYVEC